MKTKITLMAFALASSGAWAQTAHDHLFKQRTGPTQVVTSELSREDVRADLLHAIESGERVADHQATRIGPTEVDDAMR